MCRRIEGLEVRWSLTTDWKMTTKSWLIEVIGDYANHDQQHSSSRLVNEHRKCVTGVELVLSLTHVITVELVD